MNRARFYVFTLLMWLAVPLIALRHWQVWDRLPASLAVHFNAANQPNGWMSREASLRFDILLIAFLATIFTVIAYLLHHNSTVTASSWAVLLFFYGILGVICYIEESVLEFNLYGRKVDSMPVAVAIAVLVVGLILALVGFSRGRPLAGDGLICEEVQTGKAWAVVLLLGTIPLWLIAMNVPVPTARFIMIPVTVIMLGAAAMAWNGFHYLFTRHGLEVRTLGFRLKSLPREQIKDYSAVPLCPLSGYGIRGMGGHIAYAWTHCGVRVNTKDGFVFLGHPQPEKIVRDLDVMMKAAR